MEVGGTRELEVRHQKITSLLPNTPAHASKSTQESCVSPELFLTKWIISTQHAFLPPREPEFLDQLMTTIGTIHAPLLGLSGRYRFLYQPMVGLSAFCHEYKLEDDW